MIPEFPLKGVTSKNPNDILVSEFNDEELQMINEDPNYFIKNKRLMEEINLFVSKEDEFSEEKNPSVKGKIIKEEYLNSVKEGKVWK